MKIINAVFLLALFGCLFLFSLYLWFKLKYTYWKRRNVASPTPSFPFGNIVSVVRRRKLMSTFLEDIYKEYPNEPYVGIHVFYNPALVVRDPALIAKVLTEDFQHFSSRGFTTDENNALTTHLFSASGPMWKMLRSKISPTFTPGKMKVMFKTMEAVADILQDFVQIPAAAGQEINFKELLEKYAIDVIGSCAFGMECNSFVGGESEFKKYGNRTMEATLLESITIAVHMFAPELRGLVTADIMNKVDVKKFYVDMFHKITRHREVNNLQRNDFMQLLIQLRNNKLTDDEGKIVRFADGPGLGDNFLIGQLFIFFVGGFDTSSTTASFTMHELALNPEIQRKARQEVVDVLDQHGGECTYEAILEMEYLTYLINETLRKYPPIGMLFRRCTIPYDLPDSNVHIEKGTLVFIPISALQNDPKYFPDPEKFDPTRFLPENRNQFTNSAYMPFGQGPRYCIGQRFGMMQTKLAIAKLLMKYEVSPSAKTTVPIVYDTSAFTISPVGGLWLKVNELKKNL